MLIDFAELSPRSRYFVMTQTILPRPVAWVLTENADGTLNLAPFSYFNGIGSDPPVFMISAGRKSDGSPKDTRANVEARPDFVVHIAHMEMLEALNDTAVELPAGESEVERAGLETTDFGFRLPRLSDCRVAFGCTRHQIVEIGRQAVIFGEIQRVYIADDVATRDDAGRITVSAAALDPVARLGAIQYASLGDIRELARPKKPA